MFILAQNKKALINLANQSVVMAPTVAHRWALITTVDKCQLGLFESEEEARATLEDLADLIQQETHDVVVMVQERVNGTQL